MDLSCPAIVKADIHDGQADNLSGANLAMHACGSGVGISNLVLSQILPPSVIALLAFSAISTGTRSMLLLFSPLRSDACCLGTAETIEIKMANAVTPATSSHPAFATIVPALNMKS